MVTRTLHPGRVMRLPHGKYPMVRRLKGNMEGGLLYLGEKG